MVAGGRLRSFQRVTLDLEKMKSRIVRVRARPGGARKSIQEEASENDDPYLDGSCCDRARDHSGVRAI
jgi:hypothetical protein